MLDEDEDEDALEEEMKGVHEYRDRVRITKADITRIIGRTVPVGDAAGNLDIDMKRNFKLPKIELKKFGGQLIEWTGFWAQFKKIDEDVTLHEIDKFQYLIQAKEPNSRPLEVVAGYPPSAENYQKALTALKERFGRDDLLVEVYVRELLKLVIHNMNVLQGKPKVSSFFDRIESHLRALETLGVTDDKFASMLFPLVESSLPEETLRAWQRSTLSTPPVVVPDVPQKSRLSCLMDFLRREVESEERIKLARAGFGFTAEKKRPQKQFESEVPTAASLHIGSSTSKCIFCDKSHDSKECSKAQDMTLEERGKKVETRRCCFSCLKPGHTSKKCRSFTKCPLCSRRHCILMCNGLDKQRQSKLSTSSIALNSGAPEFTPTLNATMSASTCSGEVILQTIMVKVTGHSGVKVVRALVESGSQRSYLLESTAAQLSLQSSRREDIVNLLFGGRTTTRTTHQKLQVHLSRVDGANPIKLELLSHSAICGKIPRISRNQVPWSQLKTKGVCLSDVGEGTPKIEILLGADAVLDNLSLEVPTEAKTETTKRRVLSALAKIYDTFGFACPAVFPAKSMVQKLWASKVGWDEHLEEEDRKSHEKWISELHLLNDIKIPRWFFTPSSCQGSKQIHVFCDASCYAYASVAFVRAEGNPVSVQMAGAKTRLAPLKKVTIPRLELLACVIGVRLGKSVQDALKTEWPTFYWPDSTTALSWIRRTEQWGTFVNNRVKEIRSVSTPEQWRHVPGAMNPADLPSRGCSPSQLLAFHWWEGPSWLKSSQQEWPAVEKQPEEDAVQQEVKKCKATTSVLLTVEDEKPWYEFKFSNYQSCVKG